MSHWQTWVVALLLLLCVIRIGWSVYRLITRAKHGESSCDCCSADCSMRNLKKK
jgi:hypothetical protein